ncbi:hypothetical protein LXL04_020188 [Taraxacum kok-saghyz]
MLEDFRMAMLCPATFPMSKGVSVTCFHLSIIETELGHDFSKSVFNDRIVTVCDQVNRYLNLVLVNLDLCLFPLLITWLCRCEREYHIGCLREHKMADLEALPKDLLIREQEIVHEELLTFVRKKEKDKKETEKENENEKKSEEEKENEKEKEKENENEEGQEVNVVVK